MTPDFLAAAETDVMFNPFHIISLNTLSVMNDGADGFTVVHQIKSFIDFIQFHGVRDKRCQLDFAAHGIFHHSRN